MTPPTRTPLALVTEALDTLEEAQRMIDQCVLTNVQRGGRGEPGCELGWVYATANARLKLDYAIRRLRTAKERLIHQ